MLRLLITLLLAASAAASIGSVTAGKPGFMTSTPELVAPHTNVRGGPVRLPKLQRVAK